MTNYIQKTSFYLGVIGVLSIVLVLSSVSLFSMGAGAASRADCNAWAEADKCKKEIDNNCAGKPAQEKAKCIENIVSNYASVGFSAGTIKNCPTGSNAANCVTELPKVNDTGEQARRGLSLVFGIAGGVALIALLISSFNYVTAGTDADKVSRSKRAIITALIGLVIALGAQAIVLTVLGQL